MAEQQVVIERGSTSRWALSRHTQTWMILGVTVVLFVGMFVFQSAPPVTTQKSAAPGLKPTGLASPEAVAAYQTRLREAEQQMQRQAEATPPASTDRPPQTSGTSSGTADPLADEKRRKQYTSLFASNVISTRRPEAIGGMKPAAVQAEPSRTPTLDEITASAMRVSQQASPPVPASVPQTARPDEQNLPKTMITTSPIDPQAPQQRLLEGTIIDGTLINRLDGGSASPVLVLVSEDVWSHGYSQVVIPKGSRVIGETTPVMNAGESRLAVAFHRLQMPDGRTYSLDQFKGLNQVGDNGLHDQVNRHYWAMFGAAAAIGAIEGFSQWVGNQGMGSGGGRNETVVISGTTRAIAQATNQMMNHFTNRLPTITIREGHRIKVYITSDLELPVWK